MVTVAQASAHRTLAVLGLLFVSSALIAIAAYLLSTGDGFVLAGHQWATIAQRVREVVTYTGIAFGIIGAASGLAHLRGQHSAIKMDARVFAALILLLWYAAYTVLLDTRFGDENANQSAIAGIFAGDWSATQRLAVIPGYHWTVAQLSQPFGTSLIYTRTLTFLVSLAMLWVYYDAARRWKPTQADDAVIALALLPIIFPYTASAYTDGPSTALVLAGFLALTMRRYWLGALLVLLSCYVRQSNLVWMGLLPAIAAWQLWAEMRSGPTGSRVGLWTFTLKTVIPRLYPFPLAVIAFGVSFLWISDSLLWGSVPANRPRPNLGNLFAFVFYAMLLWAPIWLPTARRSTVEMISWASRQTQRFLFAGALLVVVGVALFYAYDNFHPWNQPFKFLTNIPLVLMQEQPLLRVVGIVTMIWGLLIFARLWAAQRYRVELALVIVFFAIFLLPHALVDPRYYMVPLALINLLWVYPKDGERALLWWWGGLSVFIGGAMILGHFRYVTISW